MRRLNFDMRAIERVRRDRPSKVRTAVASALYSDGLASPGMLAAVGAVAVFVSLWIWYAP